jgi:hypothetical protein
VLVPECTGNRLRFSAALEDGALPEVRFRRCASSGFLRQESYPRNRTYIQQPNSLWLAPRALGTKPGNSQCQAAGSCRMLDTDFGGHSF